MRRISEAPVIAACTAPGYGPIFNPGVIFHDGRYHLFARGVRDHYRRNEGAGARFLDYISDVLVFVSDDGTSYEFQHVLARSSQDGVYSYEDPRVQIVQSHGETRFVMSYTNLPAPETGEFWRIGVHRLGYEQGRFFLEEGSGRVIGPDGEPNKDAMIFNLRGGKVALIHRIYPNMQIAVFDSLADLWDAPDGYWAEYMPELDRHTIIRPPETSLGVGAGAPPVQTPDGLVLLFHERDGDGHYTARAALLDDATGQVKSMLAEPILRPELEWEREGDVDNVVFLQGAVARPDGTIYVTYGAADRCVGAAVLSTNELLAAFRTA